MKFLSFLLLSFFIAFRCYSQSWTKEQLEAANTAKNSSYLNAEEKEAIQYINLARLYPQLFVKNELEKLPPAETDVEKTYRQSLIADLQKRKPTQALQPDSSLYQLAKCFAVESGESGYVGHERRNCAKPKGMFGENCSYGKKKGKEIALQWLIDKDVESLGHRVNCLNAAYRKIGISTYKHKEYKYCAVADLGR